MKVTYDWLRQYCDLKLSPAELAKLLPELGMEVDALELLGADTVYDLAITANRADLLSIIGVAREIAAATGLELRIPQVSLKCSGPDARELAAVTIDAPDLCPRYTARVITGLKVLPSPPRLTEWLERLGLRPVNNVVDITNFVLMECGQPLHAFDLDRLRGRRVIVRRARPDEPITVIDGTTHKLSPETLVIADAEVPVAVAGVMGGIDTEISPNTKNVLLESAQFLPANVRRTSKSLGLASDSSYRFERGVDPKGLDWGSVRAAAMIAELAGGQVAMGVIDLGKPVPPDRTVTLRPDRTSRVLGLVIPADRQRTLLERLGFRVIAERHGELDFAVPSFRQDVSSEIDLVEEIARAHGYARIPEQTTMLVRPVPVHKADAVSARVRDLCAAMGYAEARTSSFLSLELASRFAHWPGEPNVLRNPTSREEPALRTSLLPALLEAKKTNQDHGTARVALFELSRVYARIKDEPAERTCLALLDDAGFASVRGALDSLLDELRLPEPATCEPYADANLAAGRSARLVTGGRLLGFAGEISNDLANRFDLKSAPAVAELDFDLIVELAQLERRHRPLPRFPAIRRDLCLVIDESVTWAAVAACARNAAGTLARALTFLSEFHGGSVPHGKKALAFSVTCRADDRTLTGEEADDAAARIAHALNAEFGAQLRT